MSEQTVERYTVEKQKVRSADIVVRYTVDKPYYEIKYQDNDGAWHIGYGSYKLENVYCWLNEYFEIVSYEQEIRDNAIEEFAEKLSERLTELSDNATIYGIKNIDFLTLDTVIDEIGNIAEQMKEANNNG